MREAVVVQAVRTPVGKRQGALSSVHPADLSATILNALIERAGIDPSVVDDVVWGCVSQVGEQTFDIARTAVLSAGWPESVPGTTVDRQCGSSQQAVHFAAAGVVAGHYDVVVAGGVESMSRVPMGVAATVLDDQTPIGPLYAQRYGPDLPNQGLGAEMIAKHWGLTRRAVDEFALGSHARAAEAVDAERFAGELVPVRLADGSEVRQDEGIRRGGTIDGLAVLRPAFRPDGVLSAASSSQISDGAAALLITTRERASELGVDPLARIHTAVLAASDPVMMLTAPIPATQKALGKAGLRARDIGVYEVNEAFASVPLAWRSELGVDEERLNPNGGAIAIGHPLGGSGARIMVTMVHHMLRNDLRFGLQTMCEGGGQANATILELVA
jgi:acetyl-CoA acyltransferase